MGEFEKKPVSSPRENKKVLLRERKRHTARCVANTRYVVLTGYPPGGVPGQVPPPGGPGTPPGGVRVPPRGVRVPPGGVPSQVPPRGGSGYPPGQVPPPLWTDKHLWKQYLPVVLRTRAVTNRFSPMLQQVVQSGVLFLCVGYAHGKANENIKGLFIPSVSIDVLDRFITHLTFDNNIDSSVFVSADVWGEHLKRRVVEK